MKKLLLSAMLFLAANITFSQVVLKIVEPSNIANSLNHVYVDSAQGTTPWMNVPDMDSVYNAVLDTVKMAVDSLSCGTLTNDLTGKIALVYRGSCEFGTKALNAQNAGAIAVIIVNPGGAPIGMGAGADGNSVTIPVTMISAADGAIIQQALDNGEDVVMYFGPEYGYYGDDLGIPKEKALVARAASIPSAIAANDTEFDVALGCWVYNYGSNDYTGATVTANVDYNSSSVYSSISTPFNVVAGDSAYVSFNAFSQSSYPNGEYEITYTINHILQDETPENDMLSFAFNINEEYYSLSPLDTVSGDPLNLTAIRIPPADINNFISSTSCLAFADSNASRLAVRGLSFSAATYDPLNPTTLDGEYLEFVAYEWNDNFVDMDDANFGIANLADIATTDYSYDADDQNVVIDVDFENAVVLNDNQRYLFCMTSYSEFVSFGYDNSISYDFNTDTYRQPITMINNGTQWYAGYAGLEPTMTLRVFDAAAVSVNENEVDVTPYPNPASDIITIPLSGLDGEAQLMVTDMTGKIMMSKLVYLSGNDKLQVNVADLSSGFYTFTINFDNGQVSKFNVAVTK